MAIPLFDAHCDTASLLVPQSVLLLKNKLHVDLERGSKFSPRAQVFAFFLQGDGLYDRFTGMVSNLLREIDDNIGRITLCRTGAEAADAFEQGKCAAFLSVEGGEILDCSEEKLIQAARMGIRAVNITWNYENALSGSNQTGGGLTELGRRFVKRCEELNVLVDVSHISEQGFWDVCEIAEKPLLASHSNSKALCGHPRNLTDAQFSALVKNGGVCGINLYACFLGNDPTVETIADHIEHFLSLGGEKSIGIGADFDGCDTLPEGIGGVEDMDKLYELLLRRNLSEGLIRDIFMNNMLNLFA